MPRRELLLLNVKPQGLKSHRFYRLFFGAEAPAYLMREFLDSFLELPLSKFNYEIWL
jgi:hypothetical protein